MCVGEGWNYNDRGNWITKKKLYSLWGKCLNECGAKVEWYWQRKSEVLGEKRYRMWLVSGWKCMQEWWYVTDTKTEALVAKYCTAWVVGGLKCVQQRWNDTDRGNLKYIEKNIFEWGWHVDGWVQRSGGLLLTGEMWRIVEKYYKSCELDGLLFESNGGMIQAGENWSTGRKIFTA